MEGLVNEARHGAQLRFCHHRSLRGEQSKRTTDLRDAVHAEGPELCGRWWKTLSE